MLKLGAPPLPILLDASEDIYGIGQSHPNRNHIGVFDLLIVTRGSLLMGEEEQRFQVEKKSALILYPDRHHFSYKPCSKETHFYWFHYTSKKWQELSEESPMKAIDKGDIRSSNPFTENPFGIVLSKHCNIYNWEVVNTLCQQIIHPENEAIYTWEWKRQILFQQLLQELSSNTHISKSLPSLAIAEQAAAYLRKNYQKKISYQKLGEVLRFHPNHIARCMINALGCTPIEYVNRVRLDQAKVLLLSKDWSIEKIAFNCGFSQLPYFSRMFKKKEGLSPSEFREKFVGKDVF